ncbi:RadC family protein [Thalassobacillus sp. B23F22_16]|uniref:RadC family protein n=1 Tax=Thalassobacillus sp. B23F22_16 TaxID=3459513 RepID=UPI00373DF579
METVYEIVRVKQVVMESQVKNDIVRSPEDGADIAYDFIGEDDREIFLVMCLNTKNRVIAVHRCHVGSLNASIVHPREVFKTAIMNNSASIMVAHQHPSGDPQPSQEDIHITRRLHEAGQLIGIQLLDHLVIGEKVNSRIKFNSLKEKGYL